MSGVPLSTDREPAVSFEVSVTVPTVSLMGEEETQDLRASSLGYAVFTGEWMLMSQELVDFLRLDRPEGPTHSCCLSVLRQLADSP